MEFRLDIEDYINETDYQWDGNNETVCHNLLIISRLYPPDLAVPLYGYAMPFLFVTTAITNLLVVAVLWQRHMRSPTNAILLAMALADTFTVCFPEPYFFYMYALNNYKEPLYPTAACYTWLFFHETIPNLFHTASIWLTVMLAGQRYIYVCHAPLARTWCTIFRVHVAIAVIFSLALFHQMPRFLDTVYDPVQVVWDEGEQAGHCVDACHVRYADWVQIVSLDIYYSIYFWFRVLFVHMGPCTILVVLNGLLFNAMRNAQKRRAQLLQENRKSECKKLRDSNSTTIMLICVIMVFLVTEIPLAIITLLHIIQTQWNIVIINYRLLYYYLIYSNSFIIFSYPVNFAIYCGMSRQFRETFRELFVRGSAFTRPPDGDSSRYSMVNGPRTCVTES
ncbi:unnamed protein product, partial [Meganyctiphanes norvegica]